MNSEKICDIISKEWTMFTNTKGIGGRASCQDDAQTFINARLSWWGGFNSKVINSYYDDILNAIDRNRNLVTLKYAYMMESTDLEGFEQIKHLIPEIIDRKRTLVNEIVALIIGEEEELRGSHPELFDMNRPLYSKEDRKNRTSVETYIRGELCTYSYITLELILKYIKKLHEDGEMLLEKQLKLLNADAKKLSSKAKIDKEKKQSKNTDEPTMELADILNLQLAEKIASLAEAQARKIGKPFVISICDTAGKLILLKKMDDAILASIEISQAKAITAMVYRTSTAELGKVSELKPLQTWKDPSPFGYCYLAGGRPITVLGKIIGAIGISGGTAAEDDLIAQKCSKF